MVSQSLYLIPPLPREANSQPYWPLRRGNVLKAVWESAVLPPSLGGQLESFHVSSYWFINHDYNDIQEGFAQVTWQALI